MKSKDEISLDYSSGEVLICEKDTIESRLAVG